MHAEVLNNLQELLQQLLNTAVDRSVAFTSSINNAYFQAVGADLPDSSLEMLGKLGVCVSQPSGGLCFMFLMVILVISCAIFQVPFFSC